MLSTPFTLTKVVNLLSVKLRISLASFDANAFRLSGFVPLTANGNINLEFSVHNDVIGDDGELSHSIFTKGHEYTGDAARRFVRASKVALDVAEYYLDLANQLRSAPTAIEVILDAIDADDMETVLLCIGLTTDFSEPLKHNPSDTLLTSLIKDKRFNKVITAIESDNANKAIARFIMEALIHKANISKSPFIKTKNAHKDVTPDHAVLNFIQLIRCNFPVEEITGNDIWDSMPADNLTK